LNVVKKHELIAIILLAISTVFSGAEGWEYIEDFGHLKLGSFLSFKHSNLFVCNREIETY